MFKERENEERAKMKGLITENEQARSVWALS